MKILPHYCRFDWWLLEEVLKVDLSNELPYSGCVLPDLLDTIVSRSGFEYSIVSISLKSFLTPAPFQYRPDGAGWAEIEPSLNSIAMGFSIQVTKCPPIKSL